MTSGNFKFELLDDEVLHFHVRMPEYPDEMESGCIVKQIEALKELGISSKYELMLNFDKSGNLISMELLEY